MTFKNLCIHVLWTKVASALEGCFLFALLYFRVFQIYSKLSPSLHHFSSRSNVEVIAAELAAAVVRTVAAHVDVSTATINVRHCVGLAKVLRQLKDL